MLIFNIGKTSPSGNNLSGIIKAVVAVALGAFLIITKANAMELVVQIIAGGIIGVNVVAFLISLKFPAMQMSSGSLMSVLIALLLFSFSPLLPVPSRAARAEERLASRARAGRGPPRRSRNRPR